MTLQSACLFRLIHDGGGHGGFRIPARRGYLFDPERYPFLEGRTRRRAEERINPPLVPDGVIYRVLEKLLILDGERLSYRTLDVEQIGSVYETMMGFRVEIARGASIAVKAKKPHGAPTAVDLDALLAVEPKERAKTLKALTDQELTGDALKAAKSVEDVVAALGRKVAAEATPRIVPPGAIVLQPSDERRRSGSHYTPRSLTGPIVRATLRPILEGLGPRPTPTQILELKVCDPAMGSGAFLVEACRQLGDALVDAWHAHNYVHKPPIPADEDEVLHARRLVAQRCLYGVDRNPMAVDLAKLSLWLATLAKDHPFTFLDHALRPGDSLVGVTLNQIASFSLNLKGKTDSVFQGIIRNKVQILLDHRRRLFAVKDDEPMAYDIKSRLVGHIEGQSNDLNYAAARLIELAWNPPPKREAETRRTEAVLDVFGWLTKSDDDRDVRLAHELEATRRQIWPDTEKCVTPFHWEIEFPEVFGRDAPGFDAIVGNPPFAGKNTMAEGNAAGYPDWLKQVNEGSHGNADLVAHFFRRAFDLLQPCGAFGLIATNTIGQGDTRSTGLRHICTHGGTIYAARKRLKWPGLAAVVVSVVHARKGPMAGPFDLDGRKVPLITAYLFHAGGHDDPARLSVNANKSFQGSIVLGMGFTFDDTDTKGVASPIAEMHRLIAKDAKNLERIFPYIGGDELNNDPEHRHHRFAISFGEMTEDEARRWPDLMSIIEQRVKPQRSTDNRDIRKKYWWRYGEIAPALYEAIAGFDRILAINCGATPHMSFSMMPSKAVFANTLDIFPFDQFSVFCSLQSRPHEVWARFFGSSMKDDLRYTPSDCFETFPFPPNFEADPTLEEAGHAYYEFRAALMVRNDEGLTKTYNRFHDPDERSADIDRLRELHAAMDRAVLDAYGWTDLRPTCAFLLDYEDDDGDDEGTAPSGRRRKKPWRFRWPDELRDEVLARLLQLNRDRAEQERLASPPAEAKPSKPRKATKNATDPRPPGLF